MASLKRALLLGFLTWLIAFVVAVAVFPFHEPNRGLFESIMAVTVTLVAVVMANLYFRKVEAAFLREGILLGLLWFAMNVAIDLRCSCKAR